MKLITQKAPMNPIDLRTELEAVEEQLKHATSDDEVRRLNARKRTVEKKRLKVLRREVRENDGHGLKRREGAKP